MFEFLQKLFLDLLAHRLLRIRLDLLEIDLRSLMLHQSEETCHANAEQGNDPRVDEVAALGSIRVNLSSGAVSVMLSRSLLDSSMDGPSIVGIFKASRIRSGYWLPMVSIAFVHRVAGRGS